MTDYKKYSLENLENWLHDAMSAGEATPQEIYDVIRGVVEENYYHHKHHASQAYELLALLNGNGKGKIKEYDDCVDKILSCDKDDQSPECKGAWDDFWEENYYPEEYALREAEYYTKEYPIKIDGYSVNGQSHSQYWYDYDRNDPNRDNPFLKDKVNKWVLPVQVDGLTGDCYINLPDDLLEAANLKEGDQVEWVDNKNGSFTLRGVKK